MKVLPSALLLVLLAAHHAPNSQVDAAGGGDFYTYFNRGGLGSDRWPLLQIEDNQCAGTNLVSGYGQSPVAIPDIAPDQCDTNTKNDYTFNGGDCTWDDLSYSISNNGVKVEPKTDVFGNAACTFAGMRVPHYPLDYFPAAGFHIHSFSEHSIAGKFYNAELHSVHMLDSKTTVAAAVWGTMLSVGAENPVFENYIRGWERVAAETAALCGGEAPPTAATPDATAPDATTPAPEEADAEATPAPGDEPAVEGQPPAATDEPAAPTEPAAPGDEPPATEQPEMDAGLVDLVDAPLTEEANETDTATDTATDADETAGAGRARKRNLAEEEGSAPAYEGLFSEQCRAFVHNPEPYLSSIPIAGTTPDIYRHLHNMVDADNFPTYGTYTYKGGLTTPPCSEIVNWNVLDAPLEISAGQMTRLLALIDCYQSAETCGYETVAQKLDAADSAGLFTQSSTSRPPQPLQGRTITHRCNGGPDVTKPDQSPKSPPVIEFVKPPPPEEPTNADAGARCTKRWTDDCPADPRSDPTASPNLRVNAPVWNDFAGFWTGTFRAVDRRGRPMEERFVSGRVDEDAAGDLPYSLQEVQVFKNVTVDETRYYEHTYLVLAPASEEFCSLPVPTRAKNVLGNGVCGQTGHIIYSERFGTATHEKDGRVEIVASTGLLAGTVGEGKPIGAKHVYFQNENEGLSYSETYQFLNKEKTKMSATGEKAIFSNNFPYKDDPLDQVFTYVLTQTTEEDWIAANRASQEENNIPTQVTVPPSKSGGCIFKCPDLNPQIASADPLNSPSPYEDGGQASGGFIAGMVILGVFVLLCIAYYLHRRQIKKQKERIAHRFARRVAETIKIEGSHTQLTAEALKDEFDRIDKDHSGQLSKDELRAFVESGKIGTMSNSDFNALWAALDVDGDGEVNFTEFCSFIANIGAEYDEEEHELTPEERRKSIARRLSMGSNKSGGGSGGGGGMSEHAKEVQEADKENDEAV